MIFDHMLEDAVRGAITPAVLLLLPALLAARAEDAKPRNVDPKATPEARKLLDFLYEYERVLGKKDVRRGEDGTWRVVARP